MRHLKEVLDDATAALADVELWGKIRDWSQTTFGDGRRTKGLLEHIRRELEEVSAKPDDLVEWVDVVLLAFDGYWRHGGKPEEFLDAVRAKYEVNQARKWPPPAPEDQPNHHVKETPAPQAAEKRAGPWITEDGQRLRMLAGAGPSHWVARVLFTNELGLWHAATENQEGRAEKCGRLGGYNSVARAMAACDEALRADGWVLEGLAPAPQAATALDAVYTERNRLALVVARLAEAAGLPTACVTDLENGPDWRVLYVQFPGGQASWHIPVKGLGPLAQGLPSSGVKWDGHTKAQAYDRMEMWAASVELVGPEELFLLREIANAAWRWMCTESSSRPGFVEDALMHAVNALVSYGKRKGLAVCDECDGSGACATERGGSWVTCSKCRGAGKRVAP